MQRNSELGLDVRDELAPLLFRFSEIDEPGYVEYISEWERSGEVIVPSATRRDGRSFQKMMKKWVEDETDTAVERGLVPATLFFLQATGGRLLGAIHFRHFLNERLRANGGHIGYGVRPSERKKGYAQVMLRLLLEELADRNVMRVLITCDEDNTASARTIEKCGGVLEDKVVFEDVLTRRYWITIQGTNAITPQSTE
ncbi:MAG: GNAT family N-acetyltransferase [Spirochaetaceae bacterium]|nr:MAG: GNAT family N-acetyltransferase [Spirochaetaceae bacterium]